MKELGAQATYGPFLDHLRSTEPKILLLDYDGTLAPFHVDRSRAFPYPGVPALLGRIMAAGTRVVLISGRVARELVTLAGIHPHPEIWGSHGVERLRSDGSYEVVFAKEQGTALLRAAELLRNDGLEQRLEFKPGSIAAHWRGLAEMEAESFKAKVLAAWAPLTSQQGLTLLPFDGGLEIRVPGRNKADAVRTILAETAGPVAVAYLGDDETDEDAFRELKGKGLTVLVRLEPRPCSADLWLKPPEELIEFFEQWLRACRGEA